MTLTDTGGAVLTLMLGYRKFLLKDETHQNCRIDILKHHCFTCWLCKAQAYVIVSQAWYGMVAYCD